MANIIRWDDPFAGLTSLHSQLDDMFSDMFTAPVAHSAALSMPALDVYSEDDKQLVAEVQAPGFAKDDVEVNVHNGVLEIKGEKHEKEEDKKGKKRSYMVRESHASFYRRLALPEYADADKVDAQFENGVLKVTVPFKELPKPKKIAISAGSKKK
ncbi:MAG TPA: Hsp20/alpha crystallin family protein [Candidatus Saccharimonadales bacterium]|nr:Hsp20/alpha crystallin family protein [Candidatus Saccharimonadales bacterium]